MHDLKQYGWGENWQQAWLALGLSGCVPGRVSADFGTTQQVVVADAEAPVTTMLAGNLQHRGNPDDLPKVGDWVAVRLPASRDGTMATIEAVIPRRNAITRKTAGRQVRKQIMASNVDTAFILQALDEDFSPERLERFLYQLSADHIAAVLVLNKADKADDIQPFMDAVSTLNIPVLVCSAATGAGVDAIRQAIAPGMTAVLLGSSGVGKSTLTNLLIGREAQAVREVRESDSTGQHTTTHRELFVLPGGGLLIDTPGIRELQLWGDEAGLDETFEDIVALADGCRFRNCRHGDEAGCQVQAALRSGKLPGAHYANYLKLQAELRTLKGRKLDSRLSADAVQKKKARSKMYRQADRDMRGDSDYPV